MDYIVGRVGVSRETVVDCVRSRKCDDVSAMYHMLEHSIREEERQARRQHEAACSGSNVPSVVLSASPGPPLSPTSMSPFFQSGNNPPGGQPNRSGSPVSGASSPNAVGPTEVFTEDFASSLLALEQHQRLQMEQEKLSTARRHTMGPGQTPMYLGDPLGYSAAAAVDPQQAAGQCSHLLGLPPGFPYQHNVLPQTNLTMNLQKVMNQPPERFLVKDPHLLKPPAALLGVGSSNYNRRASDGGAGWRGPAEEAAAAAAAAAAAGGSSGDPSSASPVPPVSSASLSPPTRHQSTGSEDSPEQLCLAAQQTLIDANLAAAVAAATAAAAAADSSSSSSPNEVGNTSASNPSATAHQQQRAESPLPYSVQVEQLLKQRSGTPDSPRRRRTGLDTVLEPPEISPELAQEVETRMKRDRQSPVHLMQQQHLVAGGGEAMDQSPAPSSLMAPPTSTYPSSSPISPSGSGGGGSLRTRRTGLSGLSTVMEIGKDNGGVSAGGNGGVGGGSSASSHSLHLPYSPVRRLSDGSPAYRSSSAATPSSGDPSPSDVRALQEECRRLSNETAAAYDQGLLSSSVGTGSSSSANNFLLRPPSPGDLVTAGGASLARRSSDSGVSSHLSPGGGGGGLGGGPSGPHRLRPSVSAHSATSVPMQQLYDDMYNTDPSSSPAATPGPGTGSHLSAPGAAAAGSRRFSYPNSPVHMQLQQQQQQHQQQQLAQQHASIFGTAKESSPTPARQSSSSLTQQIQSLSIQQKISRSRSSGDEASSSLERQGGGSGGSGGQRFKGSITQGVPSRKATTPTRRANAAAAAAAAAVAVGGGLTRGHSLKAQTNLASASQVRRNFHNLYELIFLLSMSSAERRSINWKKNYWCVCRMAVLFIYSVLL